ncbi:HxlR family transcriptional regulator [Bradyrhizobium sp. R2.2-H]|jgi:DNA-binding HxlR family transcriptional regulator|uniref:winged helix-turn-helix transcriptional regulator n=1 Tax=unclassified Bradyrhizobium TaxID=2631580 RepID=UPI00077E1133|nr:MULTISPECIES: helix-turn-helix domain-containing protein [unclassified Bradyrhizobium]KYK47648.1 transcriptional regulator [Bradyrhizobium liaoningense]TCU73520.1 HxlR family transcriptional regulator [Bradyrhizobium sp. Y-H1]TCU76290.1 HxlR family transcriptional regulator [Bradyrhizobium sp. R2.2-H]
MAKQAGSKTRSVRGSRTGRPIMALLDLLGRRWTLRILWELRHGPLTSRALRSACDEASPTVLQARLTELREAGFVELGDGGGYGLTPLGRDLCETFMPLHRFAERWKNSSPSPRLRGEGRGEGEPPRRR